MDLTNLATVFGPTLLTSESETLITETINTVQLHGNILLAILQMGQFPSYEEDPLDGSEPQFPPTEPRRSTTPTHEPTGHPIRPSQSAVIKSKRPIPAPRASTGKALTPRTNF